MANVSKLAGKRQSIARDFPEEIREARSRLWPLRQAARANGDTVKIIFPAKLLVNQQVMGDEFPDWFEVLHARRTPDAEPRGAPQKQRVVKPPDVGGGVNTLVNSSVYDAETSADESSSDESSMDEESNKNGDDSDTGQRDPPAAPVHGDTVQQVTVETVAADAAAATAPAAEAGGGAGPAEDQTGYTTAEDTTNG